MSSITVLILFTVFVLACLAVIVMRGARTVKREDEAGKPPTQPRWHGGPR